MAHWVWHRLLAQMEGDPDDQDFDEHCDDEVATMVEDAAADPVAGGMCPPFSGSVLLSVEHLVGPDPLVRPFPRNRPSPR